MARSTKAGTGRATRRAKGATKVAAVARAWRSANVLIVRPAHEHASITRPCAVPCCSRA